MPQEGPDSPFALFLHRLASPLGTVANHVAILQMDEEGLPEEDRACVAALSRSMDELRRLLHAAREWIEALDAPVSPRRLARAEAERALSVTLPEGVTAVQADPEALGLIASHARAHGTLEGLQRAGSALVVTWSAPKPQEGEAARDPLGAADTAPRWALAAHLARRMGAEFDVAPSDDGECVFAKLSLREMDREN
jgi:hypothetical protein